MIDIQLIGFALLAALVAGLGTYFLVPLAARFARSAGALDYPGGRRRQSAPVPRLGGIAIFAGLVSGAAFVMLVRWDTWGTHLSPSRVLALAAGTLLVFLVGVIDDLRGLTIGKKFAAEFLAAGLLVFSGWEVAVFSLPFGIEVQLSGLAGKLLAMVFIVGVTNAINLLDGLDGLAGGVVAIISVSILVYALLQGHAGTAVLMGATAGACLGFLRHNWAPARIFMGDSGSLTLGFLLAAASSYTAIKTPATVAILVPLLALGLPVFDTLLVMGVRFMRGEGQPLVRRLRTMFQADRSHIHHLMEFLVAGRSRIVTGLYLMVAGFCVLAMVVALSRNLTLGLVMVVVEFLVVLYIRSRGLAKEAAQQKPLQEPLQTADSASPAASLGEAAPHSEASVPASGNLHTVVPVSSGK